MVPTVGEKVVTLKLAETGASHLNPLHAHVKMVDRYRDFTASATVVFGLKLFEDRNHIIDFVPVMVKLLYQKQSVVKQKITSRGLRKSCVPMQPIPSLHTSLQETFKVALIGWPFSAD